MTEGEKPLVGNWDDMAKRAYREKPVQIHDLERSTVPELSPKISPGVAITEEMLEMALPKPLHVRVAEALGWQEFRTTLSRNGIEYPGWPGKAPDGEDVQQIPRYDTDWAVTGPLVERFGLSLICTACNPAGEWRFGHAYLAPCQRPGSTPLQAICNLLLALHEASTFKEID